MFFDPPSNFLQPDLELSAPPTLPNDTGESGERFSEQ